MLEFIVNKEKLKGRPYKHPCRLNPSQVKTITDCMHMCERNVICMFMWMPACKIQKQTSGDFHY